MKTNLKIYLAACSVMAALGSCSHETLMEGTSESQNKEAHTVSLQANLGMDSRIAFEEGETSLNLLWEEEDSFSVIVGKAVQTPATFMLKEGAGTSSGVFEGEIACNDGDTLYAVWPIMAQGMAGEHACYWSLAGQKGVLDDRYTFMIGSGVYNRGENVQMVFNYRTAAVRMNLQLPEGVEKITKVDVLVEQRGREGTYVNIDSGGLIFDDGTRNDGLTIENEFTVVNGEVQVVAYFFAWDHSILNNGKVVVTASDGKQYEGSMVSGNIRPGMLYDTTVEMVEKTEPVGDIVIDNKELSKALYRILGADKVSLNSDSYAVMMQDDADEVTQLSFANDDVITSMDGIENFPNLEYLYYYNEKASLTSLDLSNNLKMKNVQLVFSPITSLNLSKNVSLESILFVGMPLTSLDVSKNINLTHLNCRACRISELDITTLEKLTELYCGGQETGNINVSMTEAQKTLWDEGWNSRWENTNVTPIVVGESEIVVIENTELSYALKAKLSGYDIWINEQGFAEMKLTDVLSITSLNLDGYYDDSTQTGITSLKGIEKFVNLKRLRCSNVGLQKADLSKNTQLWYLLCYGNPNLTELDISGCNELGSIDVSGSALTSLNINHPEKISYLNYGYTSISLDLSEFTGLDLLACQGHKLSSLNLPQESKKMITQLFIENNNFTSFDVSEYPNLWSFHCGNNQLTYLDLSKAENLEYFSCDGNYIDTLDISNTIIGNPDFTPICGPQKNNITLILKATSEQKTVWKDNDWSLWNTNVYFEGEEPAKVEGGASSGEDFKNGGVF